MRIPLWCRSAAGPAAVLLATLPLGAVDVEVTLVGGDSRFGALVSQDDEAVVIDRAVWSLAGTQRHRLSLHRARVRAVEPVPSLADLYRTRAAAADDTFPAQYTLARWCLERGLRAEAFSHAKRLLDRDPDDAVVKELIETIGYLRDGERWVPQEEFAAKHGLVRYGGMLMSVAEAGARKRAATARLQAQRAEGRVAEAEHARTRLLEELRAATITLDRIQRQDRRRRTAAEAERRRGMTPEQIEDERLDAEVARAFDAQHGIQRPPQAAEAEPAELVAARDTHVDLVRALTANRDELAAAKAAHADHVRTHEEQWAIALDFARRVGR